MAKAFKIEIKGLDKLQKKIDKLPTEVRQETDGYLEKLCQRSVTEAVNRAPKNKRKGGGDLKRSIDFVGGNLKYTIFANINYAPYQEFGTGNKVRIDGRVTQYASQFRGGGKRQVNMQAQPFFFVSIFKQEENIEREYSKILDKVLSK